MNNPKKAIAFVAIILCSAISINACTFEDPAQSVVKDREQATVAQKAQNTNEKLTHPPPIVSRHKIAPRSSAYDSFRSAGLEPQTIYQIVSAAEDVSSLDRVAPGMEFELTWQDETQTTPIKLELFRSPQETLVLTQQSSAPDAPTWQGELIDYPLDIKQVTFTGTVESNLWDSAYAAGMDPRLIGELAEVFAWQIDFSREVRTGDRWRLTLEQKFAQNREVGWGNILAAEYENAGNLHTAVRFPQTGPHASYYGPDGASLRRLFLKSPLKFGRVTSKFNRNRFHPVLKQHRPHNGVDYGAAPGTPIMAVGKGTVVIAQRQGGSGNMVKIRHNSVYETAYLHLQGYGKNIRRGMRVEQGQIIGYVGSTGLATGPHLHFAFYENGRFVDPLGRKFPSADPVESKDLSLFKEIVASVLGSLPDWTIVNLKKEGKLESETI